MGDAASQKQDQGFTLAEILVALLLLGLILIAILPLLAMANRMVYDNRDRLIANQLAKNEIESILSRVTPQNYNDSAGPLVPGISRKYLDRDLAEVDADSPDLVYTITTVIGWVDDPGDDEYPSDPIPFDYKDIEVGVTAPSIFTGAVKQYADFKTFRAREGAADPIAGILVRVERAWRTGSSDPPPVVGATVTVTNPDGAVYTGITDAQGQVLIRLEPGDDSDVGIYNIKAAKAGWIPNPQEPNGEDTAVSRYSTGLAVLQMEEPVSLTLNLGSRHRGGTVVLSGSYLPGRTPISRDIAPGEQQLSFTNLWPVGPAGNTSDAYVLDVNGLVIYENDFGSQNDFVRWQEDDAAGNIYNLWTFDSSAAKWTAVYDPSLSYNTYNRLGLTISGLNRFQPANGFQVRTGEDFVSLIGQGFAIDAGTESPEHTLIRKSRSEQPLATLITSDSEWLDVITLGNAAAAAANPYDDVEILLSSDDLAAGSLKLRFDTTTNISYVAFGPLSIETDYTNPNITFASPGQDLALALFATGSP